MTKQEKQLLLVDLCARLPYGVKIKINNEEINFIFTLNCYDESDYYDDGYKFDAHSDGLTKYGLKIEDFKPYLRPMSSMTEEEREHLQILHNIISDENYGDGFSPAAWEAILDFNNYCREHHLDNGGLITLGLALEATEEMYK